MRVVLRIVLVNLASFVLAQTDSPIETELNCDMCHVGGDWSSDVGQNFDHTITSYVLEGSHADISCRNCHSGSTLPDKHNFDQVTTECGSCHKDIHNDLWGDDCERCHSPDSWTLSTQNQNHDLSNFPLRGPHRSLSCESCHLDNPRSDATLPLDCLGCHADEYYAATNPSHQLLQLSLDCEVCHAAQDRIWSKSSFNHNVTGYFLLGMHAEASCSTCHTQRVDNTPNTCVGCHMPEFEASTQPPHLAEGFPLDCETCHDSFTWNSSFLHEQTGFLLEGAHENSICSDCHAEQNFSNTPETCAGCHINEFNSTSLPPHTDAEFEETCDDCHTVIAWLPSVWDHDLESEFQLTGAHIGPACSDCHNAVPYSQQGSECVICHQSEYDESLEPNHITSNIPETCEVCHTADNWETEVIDHTQTEFPLEGAHVEVECATCHDDGYDLPLECEGCHLQEYTETTNTPSPDHTEYSFSESCIDCHNQTSWIPSSWNHDPEHTGFEILGAHLNLLPANCYDCHDEEQWTGLSAVCSSCHQTNYDDTQDPNHREYGYPDNICELCHSQEGWEPSIFDHESSSLTCQTCHFVQYTGTSNPAHAAQSFPLDCEICHSTTAWSPVTFDHDSQYFPIYSGQHRNEWNDCSQCHVDANDFGTFTCFGGGCHDMIEMNNEHCEGNECESCNGNTYPLSGVIPEDCLSCHPNGDEDDCGGDILNFFKMRTLPVPEEKKADEKD